jgi:integral membrane protein (TIGR00529 family)
LGFVEPLTGIVISFICLGLMLYKHVNLGITLNATGLILAFLTLNWAEIPRVIWSATDPSTLEGQLTMAVVMATFGIMWLSQLYKETGALDDLSRSLGRIIKNSKIVLSALPAVIGLLPVAGGALMSAPIVDSEADKIKMKPEMKAYVNIWFRHTVYPVYPTSPSLITTAALTGVTLTGIILRQIPMVTVMLIAGYLIGFWDSPKQEKMESEKSKVEKGSNIKNFLKASLPILITLIVTVFIDCLSYNMSKQGFDVLIATFAGLTVLAILFKIRVKVFARPLKSLGFYGITAAAYGAFLLRNVMGEAGISEIFRPLLAGGSLNMIFLLTVIPAVLGFLTGSPPAGIAISISILTGALNFSTSSAALIYACAYLGYLIAPTHLCFTFTADYFKTPLGRLYKYLIPSFTASIITALLVYFTPF